jgi:phosphate-selective porin
MLSPARRRALRPWIGLGLSAAVLVTPPTVWAADWKRGPGVGFSSKDLDFEIRLAGYFQSDFRSYPNWTAGDEDTGPLRSDKADIRRGRIGVEGKWKKLDYELDLDWTQPARRAIKDGDPDPVFGWGGVELKNAALDYSFHKALKIRAGHFKVPGSPEHLTSASKVDFIERSLIGQNLAPGRDWGAMLYGELLDRINYQAGVFKGDGRVELFRAETTVAGRVLYRVIDGLDAGGYFSVGDVKAPPEPPAGLLVVPRELIPQPNGFGVRGPSGFRFSDRRFVEGRRLRAGAEATLARGPVGAKAEYMHGREERKKQSAIFTDLPDEVANAWAVSATWLLTGDKKERTIKPKKPLFEGIGAIEIGARYEQLRYDDTDNVGFEGAGNRARNMRPSGLNVLTGGVSWWPTRWIRVLGNVLVDRYIDRLLAPEQGRLGNYVTFQGRLQFQFP